MDEARDCYVRWGAWAKVAQLDKTHPRIRQPDSLAAKPTIETSVETLDLATVIKMSEAVAGEIVLERLIETLMAIAVEHAGAERALFILPQGDSHWIEAEAVIRNDKVEVKRRAAVAAGCRLP